MSPEEKVRLVIDQTLTQSGWLLQDLNELDPSAALGVAVREFPTNTARWTMPYLSMGLPWVLPNLV